MISSLSLIGASSILLVYGYHKQSLGLVALNAAAIAVNTVHILLLIAG